MDTSRVNTAVTSPGGFRLLPLRREADRSQGTLLPEHIDEYVAEENAVRVIDAFVGEQDLGKLGFDVPDIHAVPSKISCTFSDAVGLERSTFWGDK